MKWKMAVAALLLFSGCVGKAYIQGRIDQAKEDREMIDARQR